MQNQNQPTPGPWAISPGDSGDASVGIGPTPPEVWAPAPNGDPVTICTIREPAYRVEPEPGDEFDEGLRLSGDAAANTRLIAAAPDLLAACKAALAALTELADAYVADPDHDIGIAAVAELARRELVAAIALATAPRTDAR